jgi:hypothetical protein
MTDTYKERATMAETIIAQTTAQDARDAARYRWLCEQDTGDRIFIATGRNGAWGECGHSSFGGFKDIADREIDALMPPSPESKP